LDTIHRAKTNKIHNTNIEHHSWLSRRFSMFVLCILFVFVLCIVSNVYSCPFLVVPSVFYVCVVYFVLENRRDNQEWAAVNIGYNTQNEDKQNTQHKHRKLTGQRFLYFCCVFCFSSLCVCIQCLQLPIPGCPVGFLCLCCVFCLSLFCVLYPMFTAAHSTERRQTKYTTQT
jgi:Na+/melibiose symporter-like transporter